MKRLLALVALLSTVPAQSAIYYVDCNAPDDRAPGTSPANAWKTIDKVNGSSFLPGDSILFNRGCTWRETLAPPSSGYPREPITFGAYGSGADPVITGSDLITPGTSWVQSSTNVWQTNLTTEPKIVFFDGTKGIKETALTNLNAATEWFWQLNVLYVYSKSDPDIAYTRPGIEAGKRNVGVYIANRNYITVDGLTTIGTNAHLVVIEGSATGNTIRNCTLSYGVGNGVIVWLTGGGANSVDGCTIHHTESDTVQWFDTYSGSGRESYLKNSHIYNAGKFGGYLKANHLIVENNTIHDCGTPGTANAGILIQAETTAAGTGLNNVIRYNEIYNTKGDDVDGDGILLDHWTGYNQVYCNVIYRNDGRGITNYNSHDNLIYNNTVYGNCQRPTFGTKTEILVSGTASRLSTNVKVKNNIAQATGASTYAIYVDANSYDRTGLDITNNDWYAAAANWYYWNSGGGNSLATWNALTPAGTDVNSDPAFTNPAGGDFTLAVGSPCVDAGADLGNAYNMALMPGSSWPNDIVTGDQYQEGRWWEIGAYLFPDGGPSTPPPTPTPVLTPTATPTPPPSGLAASFTVSPDTPTQGEPVQFTDTSTGASTWDWDFGDGTRSMGRNPVHTYAARGTFTVVLWVGNGVNYSQAVKTVTTATLVRKHLPKR